MSNRPFVNKAKELRREKLSHYRKEDDDRLPQKEAVGETQRRNNSEQRSSNNVVGPTHVTFLSRGGGEHHYDKYPRSRSGDGHGNLIFRRQDRSKNALSVNSNSKKRSPDGSPGSGYRHYGDGLRDGSASASGSSATASAGPPSYRDGSATRDYSSKKFNDDEESNLYKYMQRLQREDDRERQVVTVRQLKDLFCANENSKVLIKNMTQIFNVFEDLFHHRITGELKHEIIACLGCLGAAIGTHVKGYFEWMFDTYNLPISDDSRIVILKTLLEVLKQSTEAVVSIDIMSFLMNRVQSTLENADQSDVLLTIVDLTAYIAANAPEIFSSHFRDTVDILVGWHIDSSQSSSLTKFTSETLISFHPFWISDMDFSVTLLGQFLEDMEAYTEDLVQGLTGDTGEVHSIDDQPLSPEECLTKITSLIRVFATVLRSLGMSASPTENDIISWESLNKNLKSMLNCVTMAIEHIQAENLLLAANDCLSLLLTLAQGHSSCVLDKLLKYIQLQVSDLLSEKHMLSLLHFLAVFVKELNAQIPVSFVQSLFSPNSSLRTLKLCPSKKVQKALLSLQHSVLRLKSVPLLEEAYRCILIDLQSSYKELSGREYSFLEDGRCGTSLVKYTKVQAEIVVFSSLCALAEVGNTKHSIIGMWALKPAFFDLLVQHLTPSEVWLSKNYPALQYAILCVLFSHCTRHGHFVSSSTLISSNCSGSSSGHTSPILASVISPPSSGHLARIFVLLTSLLDSSDTCYDNRVLCLSWACELVERIQHQMTHISQSGEFLGLVQAVIKIAYSTDFTLTKQCCRVLLCVLKWINTSLPRQMLERCFEVSVLKLNSTSEEEKTLFSSMLSLLPLDIVTSGFLSSKCKLGAANCFLELGSLSIETLSVLRIGCLSRTVNVGIFSAHAFKTVISFLLQGQEPRDSSWLMRLFFSCQHGDKNVVTNSSLLKCFSQSHEGLLWFWGLWEAAQFCVHNKLRTPLGKPQDTFTSVEAALKGFLSKSQPIDNRVVSLTRAQLLLDFMEHLEKAMYNAYEGCAVTIPSPPKGVRTFFRTNKGTCQEWLSRVRMCVIRVAIHTNKPAIAVRHGYQLLQEMVEFNNFQSHDVEQVLMYIVNSLISLQCPEAILGLYLWCKDTIGQKFTWIKAAVNQAAGRFETAAHEYSCILNLPDMENFKIEENSTHKEEVKKPLEEGQLQAFLIHKTIECYKNLRNWKEVLKWTEEQRQSRPAQNGYVSTRLQLSGFSDYIRALSVFEDSVKLPVSVSWPQIDHSAVHEFCNISNRTTKVECVPWDVEYQLFLSQQKLLSRVSECISHKSAYSDHCDIKTELEGVCGSMSKLLSVCINDWPFHLSPIQTAFYVLASACTSVFNSGKKTTPGLLHRGQQLQPPDHCCSVLNQALSWLSVWLHLSVKEHGIRLQAGCMAELLLVGAHLARKQENLKLATDLLLQHTFLVSPSNSCEDLKQLSDVVTQLKPSEAALHIQRETAKLLHVCDQPNLSAKVLLHAINQHCDTNSEESVSQLSARCLLNFAKYLQQDPELIKSASDTSNDKLKSLFSSPKKHPSPEHIYFKIPANDLSSVDLEPDGIVNYNESIVGRLLQHCVLRCPSLAKGWAAFASWCYRWGRKAVDSPSDGCVELIEEEKEKALSAIPEHVPPEEQDVIMLILSHIHGGSEGEWEVSVQDLENSESLRHEIISACPSLNNCSMELADELMQVRKMVTRRAYKYYLAAAQAYFKYLQLNGTTEREDDQCEDDNVTATLRLLRLVVKHASELRDVLEEGLAKTPTAPWRGIIPQLFSRLNHPEPYVRRSISDLLSRVAQASPHLIVFPAVVGSLTLQSVGGQAAKGLLTTYLADANGDNASLNELIQEGNSQASERNSTPTDVLSEAEDNEEEEQKIAVMQNCYSALVDTLSAQDARTISEVKTLVHELRRITVLWDELWLGALNLHTAEAHRRIQTLEEEIEKVQNNQSLSSETKTELIKEKHRVFLKPTVYVLEQLKGIVSQTPETPHEQWFQNTFCSLIEETINVLQNPSDPAHPQKSWTAFKQLHQTLQHKVQEETRSQLLMDHISPVLAGLKSTIIPMPGVGSMSSQGVVSISSVHPTISVLPTKTKPKKLAFQGSDGHKYTYLFKGLEDLHLDERIMQFLSIVNNMFAKTKRNGKVLYRARHYAVTPLGPRSGLIQWLDGATPLFGLYKRWQQREATMQALKAQASGGIIVQPVILRPSEIFYNKLTPLLKEKGITNLENRKEWPLSVLVQVLQELMEETPKDLLAKELWCASTSATEWWEVTKMYNYSTAVMSMIGYIIGLGDRHLDNVLVDLQTGEMVHIDYNVCFEKGKNLRVPEKVPFRMTPNIESALGVTGIEGQFRVSCEHVMKVLRKGRETLLTLLEAFVYDPLVDWTPGGEGGYTGAVYGGGQVSNNPAGSRINMERDIAYTMFSIRVTEMMFNWNQNRADFVEGMNNLEMLLKEWLDTQVTIQTAETSLAEACQQQTVLEEALSNPSHVLFSLPQRYQDYSVVRKTVNATKEALEEKITECRNWHNLHMSALKSICGPDLSTWRHENGKEAVPDTLSVAPVIEFLQSAGQGQLVQQCEQAESELRSLLQQQQMALQNCIELLTTYATVVMQFSQTYHEQNRTYHWHQWLEGLLNDFTVARCQEVITEFHSQYGVGMDLGFIQAIMGQQYQLQTLVADINSRLMAVLERRQLETMEVTSVMDMQRQFDNFVKGFSGNKEGLNSAQSLVVSTMCTLTQNLLVMEAAAATSGSHLLDLKFWGSDWFLEDIFGQSFVMFQMSALLTLESMIPSPEITSACHLIATTHKVFNSLLDLSSHFQTIILPEAMKTIQAQEPSIVNMIHMLDKVVMASRTPLDTLIAQLDQLMQTTPQYSGCTAVQAVQQEFEMLLKGTEPPGFSGLSPGQMLFLGFNGLFTKLEADILDFYSNLPLIYVEWQAVDVVWSAQTLCPPYRTNLKTYLRDLFFLKKLQTMHQFFTLCCQLPANMASPGTQYITEEQMFMPVKVFIADVYMKQLIGLPSLMLGSTMCSLMSSLGVDTRFELSNSGDGEVSLESIGKRLVDMKAAYGHLNQVSTLMSSFETACRKQDILRRLDQSELLLRACLQRAQLQLTSHQWMHEDLLNQGSMGTLQNVTMPSRTNIMAELRKAVQTMISFESTVAMSQENYLSLTASVEQRLKWAIGANPSLNNTQEEFEESITSRIAEISTKLKLSRELVNICNSLLHFEALRTRTTEAVASDNTFLALINRCQEGCMMAENCSVQVSSMEEQLLNLQTLAEGEGITADWIKSVLEKVCKCLASHKEKLEEAKANHMAKWESVKSQVLVIRNQVLSTHHRLMSEVRTILKSLAKHEEQDQGVNPSMQVHQYLSCYREFSEDMTHIVRQLLTDRTEADSVQEIVSRLKHVLKLAEAVYDGLLSIAGASNKLAEKEESQEQSASEKSSLSVKGGSSKHMACHPQELLSGPSPSSQNPLPQPAIAATAGTEKKQQVIRDPRTGKVIQERNSYATSVWRRVKMKLDGRDPDPNKRSSISEQVDFVIKEATRMENLAVLYEGWTPWV